MKHFLILLISLSGLTTGLFADEGDILFRIDGDPVSVDEFEYIYNKNNFNNKADYSEKSLKEYLDLYINFRLKVKEAESIGLDKDANLQSELKVYQQQLYNSFFDREHLKSLVDEAVERAAYDVHISHIYVAANKEAEGTPPQEKLDKINEAYAALQSGKSFEEIAKLYSEDKYTNNDGGRLAYYTVLQIAYYSLENAAYNTPVGEYSKPIQTSLGYHIVKVNDKRPAFGLVKAAVIKVSKKRGDVDNLATKTVIQNIYDELASGGDFAEFALKFSDDQSTKNKGGEMDWFGIAKYDPIFENAVYGLKENGDLSTPFDTKEAWYIVKLTGRKKTADSEEDKELITKKVQQGDRYKIMYQEHVEGILNDFGFELVQPAYKDFREGFINAGDNFKDFFDGLGEGRTIAKIVGEEFTDVDLGKYIMTNSFKYRRLKPSLRFEKMFDDFKASKAIDFHIIEYGKENTEYGSLLNEYRDGILLFELMETNVWSRAVQDTTGLRTFFNNNRDNFKRPEMAKVHVHKVGDAKQAAFLVKALTSDPSLSDVSWLSKLTKKGISTSYDDLEILKTDDLAKKIAWKSGINTIQTDEGTAIYHVTEIEAESQRSYEESKGFAIAEYQEFLEKEWITTLREKYDVVVDEQVLRNLVKK